MKSRHIIAILILVLIAFWFLRREGYTMNASQSRDLEKSFTDNKVPEEDRSFIRQMIKDTTASGESPPGSRDPAMKIYSAYPGLVSAMQKIFPKFK